MYTDTQSWQKNSVCQKQQARETVKSRVSAGCKKNEFNFYRDSKVFKSLKWNEQQSSFFLLNVLSGSNNLKLRLRQLTVLQEAFQYFVWHFSVHHHTYYLLVRRIMNGLFYLFQLLISVQITLFYSCTT